MPPHPQLVSTYITVIGLGDGRHSVDIQSGTACGEVRERERKQNLLVIPLSNGGHVLGNHTQAFFILAPTSAVACRYLAHRLLSASLIRLPSFT